MKFAEIIWIVGILLSLVALFIIAPVELSLNGIVISFAIFALIWINLARKNLSHGSSLGMFSTFLFSSVGFFLVATVFQLLLRMFEFRFIAWVYYFALAMAFLLLVISSYKLMRIGKEFGFVTDTKKIKEVLKNNKELKAKRKRLLKLESKVKNQVGTKVKTKKKKKKAVKKKKKK